MSMLIAHNSAIRRLQEPQSVQTATKPSRTAPAVKPPAPAAGASTQEQDAKALPPGSLSEDALHQAITRALLDGKLRPGTPLRERYLAESFGVTRGLVRKVLLRLGQEGKLEMHANRGRPKRKFKPSTRRARPLRPVWCPCWRRPSPPNN